MSSNLDTVMSFLQGKGLTHNQAAGIAGNFQVESGLDPTAVNPKEGAIGLAQWEGGRRAGLQNYAKAHGGSEADLTTQLNYLWSELQGPEKKAYTWLISTNDPGVAAEVFDQYYERSSGSSRDTRVSNAKNIAAGTPDTGHGGLLNDLGGAVSGAVSGVVSGAVADSVSSWGPFVVKLLATAVAGGLVVIGATRTVSGGN